MKNNLTNIKSDNINKIDWKLLQNEMKNKFGSEIYDSWLKKLIWLMSLKIMFYYPFRQDLSEIG